MASTSSFFDRASPFVVYATSATREILVSLLRSVAATSRAILDEIIRIYFDSKNLTEKTIGLILLLNKYLCTSCDEYLVIYQQTTNANLQKSDLDEDNMNHYVYCTIEKIISQNDGYKHLNCIFDDVLKFCSFKFEHVFALISESNRVGTFSMAELNLLQYYLLNRLDRINTISQNLYIDNDKYKNYRLKCEESDSCQWKIEDEIIRQSR